MIIKSSSISRHIRQASLTLIGGRVLVNMVGVVKSLLIATYYGTSSQLDVYVLSLAPFRLISGVLLGSIQAAFIPRYLEVISKKGKQEAFSMFITFWFSIMLGLGCISIILFFGSPIIASSLGSGFNTEQITFTKSLLQLSTLVLIFTVLGDVGCFLFNSHRLFTLSALVPLVGAICSLVYLVCFHTIGVAALMYGLIIGLMVQSSVILYFIRRIHPERLLMLSLTHPEIKQTLQVMLPLLIGSAFGHVNTVIDQIMASTLPSGSISALNYAIKLHSIFSQMFIMIISRAALPFFAQQVAENNLDALKETFLSTTKRMLVILLPISLLIFFFGEPVVRLLFQRGAFTEHSTSATAGAWMAYALGLPVQAVGILTARVYNALQENKILMYVSGGSVSLNIFLNWMFMKIWGHIGIALSTSVIYAITTVVLLTILRIKLKHGAV